MVINFFGRRGSGKTTAIKGQIQFCRPPVIIVDVLGNFSNSDYTQHTDLSETILEIKDFHKNKKKKPFQVINLKTHDPELAADYLSAAIWHGNGGTLILDEVDSISIKEGSCFDQYIRYGRNHNGDLITGCRRPAEMSKNITAAANKFYCFQTHEYRDIEYFSANVFGDRADQLQRIEQYHGLYIDHDAGVTGVFHSDESGNIYHNSCEPINQPPGE